jgi:RND family efflux transporter MFP subunit
MTSPTTSTGSPTTTYDVTTEQIAACVPALQAWSTALTAAQKAVSAYAGALTTVQQQLAAQQSAANTGSGSTGSSSSSRSGTTGTGSAAATGGTGTTGGTTAGTGGAEAPGGTGGGSTATSEESKQAKILSDQAGITEAEQNLSAAQANLAASTLTAPIGGVVGSVGLTAGQSETSSSGITIVGEGAATVTVPVPLAKLPPIKVGQQATVTPPGLGQLAGTVTQISMLPTSSGTSGSTGTGSSTVTYDVTMTLPSTPQTLASGTYATTTITTASAKDVLTVPVSAVPGVTSGTARVSVVKDGVATETTVSVGAVGGGLAEIRSGLTEGEQVVIADVQAALPTNSSQNVRGVTGPTGGGAFTGGGGGGGTVVTRSGRG